MNILVKWKEDYSVNLTEIDQQHKKLIDMLNMVYDSLIREEKDDVLDQVISDMLDYAFVHFKNEEKYFALFRYKDASAHIAEHQVFTKKAEMFKCKNELDDFALKLETLIFLRDWLINHILKSDKLYLETFIKGGVK
jgi:hemerythrin